MAGLFSKIGDLTALAETVKQKGGSLVQEASAFADKLSLDRLQDDQSARPPSASPSESNKREGVYSRAAVALSREINVGSTYGVEEAKAVPSRPIAEESRPAAPPSSAGGVGSGSGRSTPIRGLVTAEKRPGSGAATPVKGVVATGSSTATTSPAPGGGATPLQGGKGRKPAAEGRASPVPPEGRGLVVAPAAAKPTSEAATRAMGSSTPPNNGARPGVVGHRSPPPGVVAREGPSPPRPARRSVFADDDDDDDDDDPIMAAMLGRPPPLPQQGAKASSGSVHSGSKGLGDRVAGEGGDEESGLLKAPPAAPPAAGQQQQRPGLMHSTSTGGTGLEGVLGAIGGSVQQLDAIKDRATAVWSATSGGMKDALGKVWTKAREQQTSPAQQQLPQRQQPSRPGGRLGRQANDMEVVVTRAADVLTEQERQHLASLRNQGILSSVARLLPTRLTNINRMYCGVILLFVSTVIFYWRWSFLWS